MLLICILAIISEVNNIVTTASTEKVVICMYSNFSKVLGVLQLTEARLKRAHPLINLLTHRFTHNYYVD